MSAPWDPFEFRYDSAQHGVPTANQIILPFDSTRVLIYLPWAPVSAGSSFLLPGPVRGKYGAAVVRYTVLSTGQAVTGAEQDLTGNTGAAGDWETQGAAGAFTVAAGVTAVREFKPLGAEFRITLTAGATPPNPIVVWGTVFYGPNFGG